MLAEEYAGFRKALPAMTRGRYSRKSAPNYRGVPGLVRKYYLYGDDQTGGGVYLWDSRDAAERLLAPPNGHF
jgi:hypothetical protein